MSAQAHKIELQAEPRTVLGRGVKHIRKQGYLPGILYGKGLAPIAVQVPVKDFAKVLKEAGESTLVYLNVDGQSYPAIIHDVARDARKDEVIHADFYKVRLDEKIKAMIPVIFEGESPAVRDEGAVFVRNVNELEVEALPQNLPHELKVDISGLAKVGDQVFLKDIKVDKDVKLLGQEDEIIATIQAAMTEEQLKEILEAPTAAPEEVEVIEKEKKEEVPEEEAPAPSTGSGPAAEKAKPETKESH